MHIVYCTCNATKCVEVASQILCMLFWHFRSFWANYLKLNGGGVEVVGLKKYATRYNISRPVTGYGSNFRDKYLWCRRDFTMRRSEFREFAIFDMLSDNLIE